MTRIGILGSGEVGQALARGLKGEGYEVRIASRTPDKLAAFAKEAGVGTGTFKEVARSARPCSTAATTSGPSGSRRG